MAAATTSCLLVLYPEVFLSAAATSLFPGRSFLLFRVSHYGPSDSTQASTCRTTPVNSWIYTSPANALPATESLEPRTMLPSRLILPRLIRSQAELLASTRPMPSVDPSAGWGNLMTPFSGWRKTMALFQRTSK